MSAGSDHAALTPEQRSAALQGLKPLIPFGGHPFLSYVLTSVADAGIEHVTIVVRAGADPIRQAYEGAAMRRLRLDFAVQAEPLGSAHALLAAEQAVGGDDFILLNADNDYPVAALAALRALHAPGLVGFARDGLLRGNVTADRLSGYAVLDVSEDGMLRGIREKPPLEDTERADVRMSMTCWRFDARIFDACRAVARSARGEYELPDAVNLAIRRGAVAWRVLPFNGPVLDLSCAEDVPAVAAQLEGRSVDL